MIVCVCVCVCVCLIPPHATQHYEEGEAGYGEGEENIYDTAADEEPQGAGLRARAVYDYEASMLCVCVCVCVCVSVIFLTHHVQLERMK